MHSVRKLMELLWKKMRRGCLSGSSIALLCLFVPVFCLLFLLNSSLPDISIDNRSKESVRRLIHGKRFEEVKLGELGEMMVTMLPDDLAFTIFVPSEKAFEHVLKLQAKDSLVEQKVNDTFAILSRVMGFSAVPQHLPSGSIPFRTEISFDSISGFRLYAWKASDGTLVVNNVRSERVDGKKGETIVHIMSGVIMDAEFQQSFPPDYED